METLLSSEPPSAAGFGPVARLLIASGKQLSTEVQSHVLALGEHAIPQLVDLLRNHQLLPSPTDFDHLNEPNSAL